MDTTPNQSRSNGQAEHGTGNNRGDTVDDAVFAKPDQEILRARELDAEQLLRSLGL